MNDEIKKTTSESISEADSGQVFDAALPPQEENDPTCDTCGVSMDYMPWHYSMGEERHLHACDQCWQTVGRSVSVPDDDYIRALQDAFEIIQADANTEQNYESLCRIGGVLAELQGTGQGQKSSV